ncbi:hypothetical protein PJ985_00325 [Streptomyces sp. ACA25]|uniref:hypothetical protein n=1 Tax=Streptomyces sp. ACA25 TaxID=3022596 RepID=UPI0023075204|nr:hypothetical protein [Streptomyces sp. ACA25]MDB1086028.1 hypothetical protein [Streptomyces sp. ACA25]
MTTLTSRTGRLAAGTAAAAVLLGLAAPAAATAFDAEDRPGASGAERLDVSPSAGGPGTEVTVTAACEPADDAVSEALERPVTLTPHEGRWTGTGRIKSRGLQTGKTFPVIVACTDATGETGSFTFAAVPVGGAQAGFGGTPDAPGYLAPLAVGGSLAATGIVGYLFVSRRRSAGNHYY